MGPVIVVKLLKTDTTHDLSQKAREDEEQREGAETKPQEEEREGRAWRWVWEQRVRNVDFERRTSSLGGENIEFEGTEREHRLLGDEEHRVCR